MRTKRISVLLTLTLCLLLLSGCGANGTATNGTEAEQTSLLAKIELKMKKYPSHTVRVTFFL